LTQLFLQFLQGQNLEQIDAIYILGDLFESWIGDEEIAAHPETIRALSAITQNGPPIYYLHGNRDFLLGEQFFTITGCQLLPEEAKIELYGTPVLLLHGDTLCTRDVAYLKARKYLRNTWLQGLFLLLPLALRKKIARGIRNKSERYTAATASEIMDVTPQQVKIIMWQHHVFHLIHGHTHRPGRHPVSLDDQLGSRTVLGAWEDRRGSVLVWYASGERELKAVDFKFNVSD
jgi:UDP-2,3-diacylglucosamine hydrolase